MDTSKLNAFIENANRAIACGPACQKDKTQDALYQQYLAAKSNLKTAPHQLDESARKYHTFKGDYDEYREKDLSQKADAIVNKYKTTFTNNIRSATIKRQSLESIKANVDNIYDLYKKYKAENEELERKLKQTNADALTNGRKSFYEDQTFDNLDYYYNIERVIYVVVAIVVAVYTFTRFNISIRLAFTIVALIVYPFIATRLLSYLIWWFHLIVSVLPKNVYTNL
jgi:hypothetical protein